MPSIPKFYQGLLVCKAPKRSLSLYNHPNRNRSAYSILMTCLFRVCLIEPN
ncbi:uncharacterized protein MELLADRAFT_96023 [Melampsora larici-populina 98AG31]|uniref:Uncharacterized protein n=1 Tax=Melampsora larici-populina (strain 98AG31 / pathotype 3-4-7) TaxID=747676 RepID=F4SAM2_MELLP|nr:uncharacterized protein MELLADRAFT_96023 [Melampsora larici-populina 98AG31]EGF98290.1 hypothetical protein MELLADRAFT_96023 [Melampsora larici-populina 98AG31]